MDRKTWQQLNHELVRAGLISQPQKLLKAFRSDRFKELAAFIHRPDGSYHLKYLRQVLQIVPIYESEFFKLARMSQANQLQDLSKEVRRFVYGALVYDHRSRAIQKYRRSRYGLNDNHKKKK